MGTHKSATSILAQSSDSVASVAGILVDFFALILLRWFCCVDFCCVDFCCANFCCVEFDCVDFFCVDFVVLIFVALIFVALIFVALIFVALIFVALIFVALILDTLILLRYWLMCWCVGALMLRIAISFLLIFGHKSRLFFAGRQFDHVEQNINKVLQHIFVSSR